MSNSVAVLLEEWLQKRLSTEAFAWIQQRRQAIESGDLTALALGFGLVSRKVPKQALQLSIEEQQAAEQARPHWQPQYWSLHDVVRILLVLSYHPATSEAFVASLDRLFAAGEVNELIALYQGLPLYPEQSAHVLRAAEGIRTNMQSVFQAVAHHNPYPAEQLPEGMWNQMILKSLFIGVSLDPIFGLSQRNNAALSQMLSEYAHERWAAHRPVPLELWRCVDLAYYPTGEADFRYILTHGTTTEQKAAALALNHFQTPSAQRLLTEFPPLQKMLENENLTWPELLSEAAEA